MNICEVPHCQKAVRSKGYCMSHYMRLYRYGDPLAGKPQRIVGNDTARFWAKVDKNGPVHPELGQCWQWIGPKTHSHRDPKAPRWTYGMFGIGPADNHRNQRAHRYAYELLIGPIPEGKQLDHLCKNTLCVNPDHLDPVTNRENSARGRAAEVNRAIQLAKTHCKRGHPLSGDNLHIEPSNGQRVCKACRNMRARERNRQKREQRQMPSEFLTT